MTLVLNHAIFLPLSSNDRFLWNLNLEVSSLRGYVSHWCVSLLDKSLIVLILSRVLLVAVDRPSAYTSFHFNWFLSLWLLLTIYVSLWIVSSESALQSSHFLAFVYVIISRLLMLRVRVGSLVQETLTIINSLKHACLIVFQSQHVLALWVLSALLLHLFELLVVKPTHHSRLLLSRRHLSLLWGYIVVSEILKLILLHLESNEFLVRCGVNVTWRRK